MLIVWILNHGPTFQKQTSYAHRIMMCILLVFCSVYVSLLQSVSWFSDCNNQTKGKCLLFQHFFVHIMYLAIFYYMAMQWLTSAIPKSIAISFASALCNDLYIYNQTRDYSMKEIMDPMEEEGLFFRNVYFQFMTTMIVGGVWFLICAKDILNLINNHCNKMLSGLVLCHDVFFFIQMV